jgi:hypothetical protein
MRVLEVVAVRKAVADHMAVAGVGSAVVVTVSLSPYPTSTGAAWTG